MAPLLALADVAVVTKTDLVSQAEKEVFRESIRKVVPDIDIVETNAIQGTGLRYLMRRIVNQPEIGSDPIVLKGSPPLGVCTVCIGKKKRSDGKITLESSDLWICQIPFTEVTDGD